MSHRKLAFGLWPTRAGLASLVLVAVFASARADAQYSVSNQWIYQLELLGQQDWDALGKALVPQSVRGSMALVFPDGRAPITDRATIESWVTSGKPLRAVCFPGITGDAAASWSMAKQVGIANARHDHDQQPVLAVNTGWTDWMAAVGHGLELTWLRPAIDAGRAAPEPISGMVAGMLKARLAKSSAPVGLVGHSAGGYYTANVAYLLEPEQRSSLRVYNVGLAARLPTKTPALQLVGTSDTLAQVNSSPDGLTSPNTRIVDGMSHLTGKLFRLGDSFSTRPWEIQPIDTAFPRPSQGKGLPLRSGAALRNLAGQLEKNAGAVEGVAKNNRASFGAKGMLSLKLDHDAGLLKLNAERAGLLADLAEAKQKKNAGAMATARQALIQNRTARQTARGQLEHARARVMRHMGTDSVDFFGMVAGETMASMNPFRIWEKAMQGGMVAVNWSAQWARVAMSSPMVNPWGAYRPSTPNTPPARSRTK